jgi:hypothetical protein
MPSKSCFSCTCTFWHGTTTIPACRYKLWLAPCLRCVTHICYNTSLLLLLLRLLCCAAVFAAFFAAVAVYNRLDFTITRDEKWQERQAHDKALGLIQQLTEFWDSE